MPNPSFEDTISCPDFQGFTFYSYTPPWFSPNINTPDIFNTCAINPWVGVPNNFFGYQLANTGQGYSGFARNTEDGVEYLSVKFISQLQAGKKYCIHFYVNPGNHTYYVIDAIGAYLSVDSIHQSDYAYLQYIPQIENPLGNIISDTVNWTEISGEYIALGGEQYINIGFFRPDSLVHSTTNDTLNSTVSYPYYYLDDVSVCLCDPITQTNQLTIYNAFTPNADGVNDVFHIKGANIKELHAKIINRWGQVLYKWDDLNGGWDGKYNNMYVGAGAYFWVVTVVYEDGSVEERKGALELIR